MKQKLNDPSNMHFQNFGNVSMLRSVKDHIFKLYERNVKSKNMFLYKSTFMAQAYY